MDRQRRAWMLAKVLKANPREFAVSHSSPCPVCHKPDWCVANEKVALCKRAEGMGLAGDSDEKGWGRAFILDDTAIPNGTPPPKKRRATDEELDARFRPLVGQWIDNLPGRLGVLAKELGVSRSSLLALGCGYNPTESCWTFPEYNATGQIIGVSRRFAHGEKRQVGGSRRGVSLGAGWDRYLTPILVVEGPTCTAAGLTLEIATIGRPSNTGGLDLLSQLLTRYEDRRIVIMGERDRKGDGRYPGADGMKKLTRELRVRLGRPVHGRMPPDGAKDLREWVNIYLGDPEETDIAVALGRKVFG